MVDSGILSAASSGQIPSENTTKNPSHDQKQKKWKFMEDENERQGCGVCCAWTSLIIGILTFFFILLVAFTFSFLQSSLPKICIKELNITTLNLSQEKQKTFLTANVELLLNVTNKNDKYDLSYGKMKIRVSTDSIDLGRTEISPFKQSPKQISELKVRIGVKNLEVNGEDGEALQSDWKKKQVVIDVVLKGTIGMGFGKGLKLNGLPFTVLCNNIDQPSIYNGLQPKCHANMLSFK